MSRQSKSTASKKKLIGFVLAGIVVVPLAYGVWAQPIFSKVDQNQVK